MNEPICGCDLMVSDARRREGDPMADNRMITPGASRLSEAPVLSTSAVPPPPTTRVQLSPADYAELIRELDELRSRHRGELAQRLRDARDFGSPADDDDRLAAFEDAAVDEARIAQLEQLARCASVVAVGEDADGTAGLGSTVRVADAAGETMEFALVGRRAANSAPREVTLASPVGEALLGVRAGDVARVALPSGRVRRLRVLDVTSGPRAARSSRPGTAAKAA
jgi:transcription elongation factor GreA